MKIRKLVLIPVFFLSMFGCVPEEEEMIVESCEGFDFTIPARDWMLLLPGPDYVFRSGEKTRKVISEYRISEPFLVSTDPDRIRAGESRCHGLYSSNHWTEDHTVYIFNEVGYGKSSGLGHMNVGFQQMMFSLEIVNDTLVGKRINYTVDDPEDYLFKNYSSLVLNGKNYDKVFKISQSNPNTQPQEIYLASRLGLVAFVMKDSLWIVD